MSLDGSAKFLCRILGDFRQIFADFDEFSFTYLLIFVKLKFLTNSVDFRQIFVDF